MKLRKGSRVRVKSGPLAGLDGVVTRTFEVVEFETWLQREVHVVKAEDVERFEKKGRRR